MKVRLEEISHGQEEVIIRYKQMNASIQAIIDLVQANHEKILVSSERGSHFLLVDDILYFESIDGNTFAYSKNAVYQVNQTLRDLVQTYGKRDFFVHQSQWFLISIELTALRANLLGGFKQLWIMTKRFLSHVNMLRP